MLLEQLFKDSALGRFVRWGEGPEGFPSHGLAAQETGTPREVCFINEEGEEASSLALSR